MTPAPTGTAIESLQKAAGTHGADTLSRIARGLTPRPDKEWPEPEGFRVPERWRRLVPESEHSADSAGSTTEALTPAQARLAALRARLSKKLAEDFASQHGAMQSRHHTGHTYHTSLL